MPRTCIDILYTRQYVCRTDGVQNFCTVSAMVSASERLKKLRMAADPPISIRRMAEELGIGFPRYAYFEDSKRFKKRELPIDLTRKIAEVLALRGIAPAQVMLLAGLREDEAEPEAQAIEAAKPDVQYINMAVVLPSEAALTDMFEGLLAFVPEGASRAEAARILAQRLPTGFAATGSFAPGQSTAPAPEGAAVSPPPAKDHRASSRS